MKFAIVLLGAGLVAAAPKAEPEAARLLFSRGSSVGLGSTVAVSRTVGLVGRTTVGHVSAPACTRTPVKECVPRTVETPRKVCQTVVDVFEDTTITERCQEVITTTCTQTSEESHITESIASTDTVKIEEGVPVDAQTLGRASGVLQRHVARTVCDTVVDSHEVEDCTEPITEVCEQTN